MFLVLFWASAFFVGRDVIISVFVSSRTDGLDLSSILKLPSVVDGVPPKVRKFWLPSPRGWEICENFRRRVFQVGGDG